MAMSTAVLAEGEPTSEINTTPLIDVMLVLLVMLIVTLPPQYHGTTLDTPRPCPDCKVDPLPDPIRIAIDFNGAIFWNGEAINTAEADQRLASEAHRDPQPEIHIEPHRLASYGAVAHIMAVAQRDGLTRIGVAGGT